MASILDKQASNFVKQMDMADQRFKARTAERENIVKHINLRDVRGANESKHVELRLERLREHAVPHIAERPVEIALERIIAKNDLVGADYLSKLANATNATGRVVIGGESVEGYGTGFLVGPDLMMTNNHVFPSAEAAKSSWLEMGYERDAQGTLKKPTVFVIEPDRFFYTNERLDFSLVAVSSKSLDGKPLSGMGTIKLIGSKGKLLNGEYVTIIQHPGGRPKEFAIRGNQVLDIFDDFIHYTADTEGGSSGSPVFNDQFELVALHHSGVPRKDAKGSILAVGGGTWKPTMGEDKIEWIANEGVRVSSIVKDLSQQSFNLDEKKFVGGMMNSETKVNGTPKPNPTVASIAQSTARVEHGSAHYAGEEITYQLNLPITIRVSVGTPTSVDMGHDFATTEARPGATRPLQRYMGRDGYDPNFLSEVIDLPGFGVHSDSLTELMDARGETELKYRHFSIYMHRQRRAALVTAVNIDGSKSVSLGRDDRNWNETAETWFFDPRIPREAQLGDGEGVYESRIIDRGHQVRREDPVWGEHNEACQANDDTFHFTNSMPQHAKLNQKTWLALENSVLKYARENDARVSVFTGPVLAADDPEMAGYKVPMEYYKVVIGEVGGEIRVAGYIQSQAEWSSDFRERASFDPTTVKVYRVPLAEISEKTGLDFSRLERFQNSIHESLRVGESFRAGGRKLVFGRWTEGKPVL